MATNKKSPKVLRNGVENLIPMNERTPEERKRIGQLGVEARKKKREEKMALQQAMKALLTMDITTQKQKHFRGEAISLILISTNKSRSNCVYRRRLGSGTPIK